MQFLDKIKNSPDGLTSEQELAKYVTYLGGYPGIMMGRYFNGAESVPSLLAATEIMRPYQHDEVWSEFSSEENKRRAVLASVIKMKWKTNSFLEAYPSLNGTIMLKR